MYRLFMCHIYIHSLQDSIQFTIMGNLTKLKKVIVIFQNDENLMV